MGVSNDLITSVSTQAPCTSKCMLTQKIKFKYDQSQTANQGLSCSQSNNFLSRFCALSVKVFPLVLVGRALLTTCRLALPNWNQFLLK